MRVAIVLMPILSGAWILGDASFSDQFWQIAERFGVWAAFCLLLTIVLVWLSWRRECRMAKRIDDLEAERTQTAVALNENGNKLQQAVLLQQQQVDIMRALVTELRCRPCLKDRP